jgi:uncharacterized protein (DUF1800 family)
MPMATRAELAHLLRRATFGPRAEEVDAAEHAGTAATLAGLLRPTAPDAGAAAAPMPAFAADPRFTLGPNATREARQQAQQWEAESTATARLWWLDRMVAADHQLAEKLVFFWHGHWATSIQKVYDPGMMLRQQQTFRDLGTGDFGAFLRAMLRDPAMILWLDGESNTAKAPNENLAREAMELFTLGVGNYTETDVRQAARALTGWQVNRAARTSALNPKRHDGGDKTILGRTGALDLDGFAGMLLDQSANGAFLATRLWYRFAADQPIAADVRDRLVSAYRTGRDITALLSAMFGDPAFAGTRGQLVRQPTEWAVGAMRQLGIRPSRLPADAQRQLTAGLTSMGQTLLAPPSVGGWPGGTAWLTSSGAETRLRLGTLLASHADQPLLRQLAAAPAAQRPEALARLLVVDAFTPRTRAVLAPVADPQRLVALGLASPEYAVC